MVTKEWTGRFGRGPWLALGGAVLVLAGAGGGAGAVALTRPAVEMAPTTPTAIARLADGRGIVTVRGQVAGVFGDRVLVRDATGQTLVDVGHGRAASPAVGTPLTAQGRFHDGQLHARYLIAADGTVEEVGPPPPPHGPGGPGGPPPRLAGADMPPPPGATPPPPPARCGDAGGPPPPAAPPARG